MISYNEEGSVTEVDLDNLNIVKMNMNGIFEYRPLGESAFYQALEHKDYDYDKSTKIFIDYIGRLFKYSRDKNGRLSQLTYVQFMRMYEDIKHNGLRPCAILLFADFQRHPNLKLVEKSGTSCSPKNPHGMSGLCAFDGQHRLSILKHLGFKKIYGTHGAGSAWNRYTITSYE